MRMESTKDRVLNEAVWPPNGMDRAEVISVLLLVLAIASCSGGGGAGRTTIKVSDSAGVTITYTRIGNDAPSCEVTGEILRIGTADEQQGPTLHRVESATLLRDGRIAITNRGTSQVMVFASRGSRQRVRAQG